jgi:hypothetical protein
MKPADTTTIANLPGDAEADAEARKVHAADAVKVWRWILIRLRP